MSSLGGKRVLLVVTGGVAAYKSAYLARRLVENGAEVKSVMTRSASQFLGPQTLSAITGHKAATDLFGSASVSPHTELARWAELIVIAPATADFLAKMAGGLAGDLAGATVLASTAPVVVAPAMHTEMWVNQATQANVALLAGRGVSMVGPTEGDLAGGDIGMGRMVEPDDILVAVNSMFDQPLEGLSVLVTAGGTREPVDPVRFIGNRSSGKMGHAVANAATALGADVTLVTTSDLPSPAGMTRVEVESASQMEKAVVEGAPYDVAVMTAAVADFTPSQSLSHKLARQDGPPDLTLVPTPDILARAGQLEPRPYLVGFAAEVGDLSRAAVKAKDKGVDLLVANDVSKPASGFGSDTNEVVIIHADGSTDEWPMMEKSEVATRLWEVIGSAVAEK